MKTFRTIFSGMVQGVGFRYTALGIARQLSVKGYTRNLADGNVEIIVQGLREDCDKLIYELKNQMSRYIVDVDVQEIETEEEFEKFFIKF